MCSPTEHLSLSACNQCWCMGWGGGTQNTACSADFTAPRACWASGIKDHTMLEENKSKPITLNSFNMLKGGRKKIFDQLAEATSFLFYVFISHSPSEQIRRFLFNSQTVSRVANSCLNPSCNNGFWCIQHDAGIYQGHRAEKFGQIRYVWTRLHLWQDFFLFIPTSQNVFFFFIPNQFCFPLLFSVENCK